MVIHAELRDWLGHSGALLGCRQAIGAAAESPHPLAGGDRQKHTGLDMTLQRESRDMNTVALPDICPSF